MSNQKDSYVAENGITLGIALLALFVIFGVGIPRWFADDADAAHSGGSTEAIELPDTLPGGFAAADVASSWDGVKQQGQSVPTAQVTQFRQQAMSMKDEQSKQTSDALGLAATSRVYISKSLETVVVQAARGSSDAWFPGAGGEYSKVGSSTCYTAMSQSGGSQNLCRRTDSDLTVVVQASSTDQAVEMIDDIWTELA